MLEPTRHIRKNSGGHQPSLRPKLMGAGAALGIIGGIIAYPPQPYYPPQQSYYPPQPAYAPAAPATGSTEIALTSGDGGNFYVDGTVDGFPVRFVLDTGASVVQIPPDFARQLYLSGQLTEADYRGHDEFGMANDSHEIQPIVNLRSLTIGDRTVYNVRATIGKAGSDPLLGQTFLSQFGSYTIDNRRNVLVLG